MFFIRLQLTEQIMRLVLSATICTTNIFKNKVQIIKVAQKLLSYYKK